MPERGLMVDVVEKISQYSPDKVVFTKKDLLSWLEERNKSSLEQLRKDLFNFNQLVHVEKQEVEYGPLIEERYRCYFIFTQNRGRCYVIKFNHQIKVITAFPLGRTTLKRYRRKFK